MRLRALAAGLVHPRTTVRWRLTLLYGGLFLVCGAALLAITYVLVSQASTTGPAVVIGPQPIRGSALNSASPPGFGGNVQNAVPFSSPGHKPQAREVPSGFQALLRSSAGRAVVRYVGSQQRIADLQQLEVESAIALAIMAVISAGLGWVVAGRVLRPLRAITDTARQISEDNLHERLAMAGPRDELRTLADTIDELLERLEGAFDAQRRFVANASHELRTPLAVERALLEMIVTDPHATVASFRATCRQVLDENEQQEQLIGALLDLAQSQRGLERREPIDLAVIVEDVLGSRERDLSDRRLQVEVALAPATLSGDSRLIERLVSNLVENAIRHNEAGGYVGVQVQERALEATLVVANSGPRVPPDEVDRLLRPFQRLSGDRVGHRGGLGLGLSIVAAIATAHDAQLDVRARSSGGLHVEVRFPVFRALKRSDAPAAGETAPAVGLPRV